jgi:membrane protein
VPDDVIGIVQDQMRKISEGDSGGILTFGLILALWSSSAAMVGLIDALNRAYDIEEARPWWKVRLHAIGLTMALAAFILVAFALVLVGPTAAKHIARATGFGSVFAWSWKILQWPLILALVSLGTGLVHYFAPDAEQRWVWITPGAVLTTILWLVASLGFKLYVSNFGSYTETYGTVEGLTFRMGQTHVQRYLRPLLQRILARDIDPAFVVSHRLPCPGRPRATGCSTTGPTTAPRSFS